jgi:hypothetical protein
MDTRRLPASIDTTPESLALTLENEVEVLELSAVARPRRLPVGRIAVIVLIGLLAGLVALAGIPGRSEFGFDRPLPNFFSTTTEAQ